MTDDASLIETLGRSMSDISEEAYCAGWYCGTEYYVPELCRRAIRAQQPQPWSRAIITPGRAQELLEIVRTLGHWVKLNDEGTGYEPFDPFPTPLEYRLELNKDLKRRIRE
jgi:hypothetical protein